MIVKSELMGRINNNLRLVSDTLEHYEIAMRRPDPRPAWKNEYYDRLEAARLNTITLLGYIEMLRDEHDIR